MRTILPALFCLLIACFSAALAAEDEAWVAARATDEVSYTLDNKTWLPLRKGTVVPNNAWISTGSRGRLQLVRGTESIAFHPNTLASVVTRGSGKNRKTEVNQHVGQIVLEIEKRQKPHTTVQTPFLAAVVKGTKFTVEVGAANAAVAVDQGVVEVTGFKSRERSNLTAGQKAAVTEAGMSVEGRTQQPAVTRVLFSLQSLKAGLALRDAPVDATAKGARAAQAIDATISKSVKAASAGTEAKSERGAHSSKGTDTVSDRGKSSKQPSGHSGSNGNSRGNGNGHSGANSGGNSSSSGGGNSSGKGGGKGNGKSGSE